MTETWKDVPSRSTHEVSSFGRIRNKHNKRILKQQLIEGGYMKINIAKGTYFVHRLVALAFLPNPLCKKTVDHKNKKRADNRLENLRWADFAEQSANRAICKTNNARGVWQCDLESGVQIAFFATIKAAGLTVSERDDGFKKISDAALGKVKSAWGFKWQYVQCEGLPGEQWKSFLTQGSKQYYVSDHGRIRSHSLTNLCKDARLLKHTVDNNGYLTTVNNMAIHILVAKAFVHNPEPDKFTIVNHKNGDKKNPHFENLEWTDYQGNTQHAMDTGLRSNVKQVAHLDNEGNLIDVYNSCAAAAEKLHVNTRSVNKCCKGELKTCGTAKLRFRYNDTNSDILGKATQPEEKKPAAKLGKPKKVSAFDLTGLLLSTHDSIAEASRVLRTNYKTICQHCEGRVKHPQGSIYFRYSA